MSSTKPQSIVHQIGRIGSKIAKPICRRRKRIRMQRKIKALEEAASLRSSHQSTTQSMSDVSSIMEDSVLHDSYSPDAWNQSIRTAIISDNEDRDDASSQGDYHTVDSDDFGFSDIEEDSMLFETVDQNELLSECFLTNEHSDVIFLIHFFSKETSLSDAVEDVLSIRVLETKSNCECRRINSSSAPLFTAKLQIDTEQPTIVAVKNGKVLSKVSNISSSECNEVTQWLTRTRILQNNSSSDTFTGLSTRT